MKIFGLFLIAPLISYFAPRWECAFALVPTYWPAKTLWVTATSGASSWIYLLAGLAYQVLLLWILLRRFEFVMHHPAA